MENELIRICGVGIVCSLGALLLKGIGSGQAVSLRLLGIIVIFGVSVAIAAAVLAETAKLLDVSALGEYTVRMMKALGLAMLSGVAADICRDCGESTVATGVETVGNLCILSLCVPLFAELVGYAQTLLGMS